MRVVIVANGSGELPESFEYIAGRADIIVAADGGANSCAQAGYVPHTLIGDLDSIDSELLRKYQEEPVNILQHPTRKDSTDLELAFDFAQGLGAKEIDLFGALGGRWDMSLSNILLASQTKYSQIAITIHDQAALIRILHRGKHLIKAPIGARISLLPIGGDVHDLILKGFEYPLTNEVLGFGSSRGLSNVVAEKPAAVQLGKGVVAVILSREG